MAAPTMTAPAMAADGSNTEPTIARYTRMTRDGRRLHYELICLQQPEIARACGSGQKSGTDRRPVDPPPVVQFRIFEGPTLEEAKDITSVFNVNFFCYADLQHARPMANGRVQTPAATSPPVLSGQPASAMALLDRPLEAGYFLFPDLSVRHEGRYILGFTLYEEVKEEMDHDPETWDETDSNPSFWNRIRVESNPFSVYSAKKFPGLKHSTDLSRTISEQGCRVRIRREVRMRRREDKGGSTPTGGSSNRSGDGSRSGGRRAQPAAELPAEYRARSPSNSSQHRNSYTKPERRPSDAGSYPPPPAPVPMASPHVRYGSDASNPSYTSQYSQPAQAPPPISPTSAHYSGQPSPYGAAPPQSYSYPSRPAPSYPPTPSDTYDRRSSVATAVPPSPSHAHFAVKDEYRRESLVIKTEPDYPRALEPLRRDSTPLTPAASTPACQLPPLSTMTRKPTLPSMVPYPQTSQPPRPVDFIEAAPPSDPVAQEPVRAGAKRGFNDTFAENTDALHDGRRQEDGHHKIAGRTLRDLMDSVGTGFLAYTRADGNLTYKPSENFYQ